MSALIYRSKRWVRQKKPNGVGTYVHVVKQEKKSFYGQE